MSSTYRITMGMAIYWTAAYVAVLLFALIVVPAEWLRLPTDSFEFWFIALFYVGLAWGWYGYLTTPFAMQLVDGRIRFRSLLRRREIEVSAIRSVSKGLLLWHQITFNFAGGSLVIPAQIDGLSEFLSRLKELNPGIEIRGL